MKFSNFMLILIACVVIMLPAAARDILLVNSGLTCTKYDCVTGANLGSSNLMLGTTMATEPNGIIDMPITTGIMRRDINGNRLSDISWSNSSFYGTMQGLAWGPDGYLYTANTYSNCIQRMNPLTGACDRLNLSVSISQPSGITFGADGDLYVCANYDPRTAERQIGRFNVSTGTLVEKYTGTKDLMVPQQVLTASDGSIYALNQCDFGLYKLNRTLGQFDEVLPRGLSGGFFSMVANPAGGLFVSVYDSKTSRFSIMRYDSATSNLSYVATGQKGYMAVVRDVPEPTSALGLMVGLTGLMPMMCVSKRRKKTEAKKHL